MNEIGSRGVQDNLIISVDNLKEFSGAIKSKYPKSEIQKCIVHQIRNSIKYVASKDMKEFTKDLKIGIKISVYIIFIDLSRVLHRNWDIFKISYLNSV